MLTTSDVGNAAAGVDLLFGNAGLTHQMCLVVCLRPVDRRCSASAARHMGGGKGFEWGLVRVDCIFPCSNLRPPDSVVPTPQPALPQNQGLERNKDLQTFLPRAIVLLQLSFMCVRGGREFLPQFRIQWSGPLSPNPHEEAICYQGVGGGGGAESQRPRTDCCFRWQGLPRVTGEVQHEAQNVRQVQPRQDSDTASSQPIEYAQEN